MAAEQRRDRLGTGLEHHVLRLARRNALRFQRERDGLVIGVAQTVRDAEGERLRILLERLDDFPAAAQRRIRAHGDADVLCGHHRERRDVLVADAAADDGIDHRAGPG
ncbi:hypothetical protein D3C83_44010 [compost metagenome]